MWSPGMWTERELSSKVQLSHAGSWAYGLPRPAEPSMCLGLPHPSALGGPQHPWTGRSMENVPVQADWSVGPRAGSPGPREGTQVGGHPQQAEQRSGQLWRRPARSLCPPRSRTPGCSRHRKLVVRGLRPQAAGRGGRAEVRPGASDPSLEGFWPESPPWGPAFA